MGVRIGKIDVESLGPIRNFSAEFGVFNLIYSPNERGKTFLTEFIIQSLFKDIRRWSNLRGGGSGKVWVSGMGDMPIDFSPLSRKKLEDYWEKDRFGIPPSMAKLLVVKGGEAVIDEQDAGVSRCLIKEVLSGISILDKIDSDDNISKTIKSAELKDGNINIRQQGEGKDYTNYKNQIKQIEDLFGEIESEPTRGIIETYKVREKELETQRERLNRAKRHKAYMTSEGIKKLKEQLNQMPEDEFNQLASDITTYNTIKKSHEGESGNYIELQKKGKDFPWLQNALSKYKELTTNIVPSPSKLYLYLAGILFLATVVLILCNQRIFSILSLAGTFASFSVYIKKYHDSSKYIGQHEEISRIKQEFKNKVGQDLTDIALLETILKEQEKNHNKAETVREQMEKEEKGKHILESSIKQRLLNLTDRQVDVSEWDKMVGDLREEYKGLEDDLNEERMKLSSLGIDETDYLEENTEINYSQEEYKDTEKELHDIQEKIERQKKQHSDLKYKTCSMVGVDPSIDWGELVERLREKRERLQEDYRQITDRIMAGNIVHNIIEQLRREEDIKIQEGLESDTILKPLCDLTQRYKKLTIDGDKLTVSDDYNTFDIKDLSTGAKEQVMLALRIGFSTKLLKRDALFLILDDAFQHSDWRKREILVEKLADVSETGWQIIYLTMDDHIKGLFDKIGREFGDGYKSLEIR